MERVDRVLQNNGIIFFLQLVNSFLAIKDLDIFFCEGTPPSRDSEGQPMLTQDFQVLRFWLQLLSEPNNFLVAAHLLLFLYVTSLLCLCYVLFTLQC
jgi:hypothetical protein